MLVKNVGHVLMFRLHLHQILNKTAHFFMILCFLLILIIPNQTDHYEAQEPSLKTKIFDPIIPPKNFSIEYEQLQKGIYVSIVKGYLPYESIMVTYPCPISQPQSEQENIIESVIYSLQKDKNLAKNIVFLCYSSNEYFKEFLKVHHQLTVPSKSLNFTRLSSDIGIIRAGLNIDFANKGSKIFYKIYGNKGIYPDVDYFLSLKELMASLGISWLPCEVIYKNPVYSLIRKNFKSGELFIKELLCQFHELLFDPKQLESIHSLMLQNGIQAATIKSYSSSSQEPIAKERLSKLILSFVKQFSLFEDHLHSASTIYYPLNQQRHVNTKGMIIPGLLFLVFSVAYLVDLYCHSPLKFSPSSENTIDIFNIPIAVSLFISSWQYYLIGSISYSFWFGIPLRFISLKYMKMNEISKKYIRIVLTAFNSVMVYHLAFYLTPLSFVGMACACIIAFLPQKICLVSCWSILLLSVIYLGDLQILSVFSLSNMILIVLYPLSIWISLI